MAEFVQNIVSNIASTVAKSALNFGANFAQTTVKLAKEDIAAGRVVYPNNNPSPTTTTTSSPSVSATLAAQVAIDSAVSQVAVQGATAVSVETDRKLAIQAQATAKAADNEEKRQSGGDALSTGAIIAIIAAFALMFIMLALYLAA